MDDHVEYDFVVEPGAVRRFAEAAWDDDPEYGAGRHGTPVPPTFLGAAATIAGRPHALRVFGFDVGRAFHGSETITMERSVRTGDVLRVNESFELLPNVYGRRGGRMRRFRRRCAFRLLNGPHVALVDRIILETEHPPATAARDTCRARAAFDDGLEPRRDPVPPRLPREGATADVVLPGCEFGPLTLTDFVRYAAASGDLTAIHFDDEAANSRGYPGPFAMGMLSAAFIGHTLQSWLDLKPTWRLEVRFHDLVWPGETLQVGGAMTGSDDARSSTRVDCAADGRPVTTATLDRGACTRPSRRKPYLSR